MPPGIEARAGGWGYLLGDEGSGYWLGREAVRHSLRRMDSGRACGRADQGAAGVLRLDPGRAHRALPPGHHAPLLGRGVAGDFCRRRQGHAHALALVDQAAADLAGMAAKVAGQLGISGPIVLGSGLGSNVPALQEAFKSNWPSAASRMCTSWRRTPSLAIPLLVEGRLAQPSFAGC